MADLRGPAVVVPIGDAAKVELLHPRGRPAQAQTHQGVQTQIKAAPLVGQQLHRLLHLVGALAVRTEAGEKYRRPQVQIEGDERAARIRRLEIRLVAHVRRMLRRSISMERRHHVGTDTRRQRKRKG